MARSLTCVQGIKCIYLKSEASWELGKHILELLTGSLRFYVMDAQYSLTRNVGLSGKERMAEIILSITRAT